MRGMRGFYGGAEIRLTREDLKKALEDVINKKILRAGLIDGMDYHVVDEVTLHPHAKYVARVSVSVKE